MLGYSPCVRISFPISNLMHALLFYLNSCIHDLLVCLQLSIFRTPDKRVRILPLHHEVGCVQLPAHINRKVNALAMKGPTHCTGWGLVHCPFSLGANKPCTTWAWFVRCLFSMTSNHTLISSLASTFLPSNLGQTAWSPNEQWNKINTEKRSWFLKK